MAVLSVVVGGCSTPAPRPATPSPSRSWVWKTPEPPTPSVSPRPGPLPTIEADVWASWALYDRETGTITEVGGQPGTSTTESMIKVAVVAQYLADLEKAGRGPDPAETLMMSAAIRDSDNDATERLYRRGGGNDMLLRVIGTCQLHALTKPGWWSETQMSAMDAARLGACIAAGRVTSAEWANWILGEMRGVRGEGLFGIIEARPDDDGRPLAIKNGWTVRDDGWHVNCLAVATFWTLAVMTRYPAGRGLGYGAALCRDVAAAVAAPQAPPSVPPNIVV